MPHSNVVTSVGGPFPGSPAATFSFERPSRSPEGLGCRWHVDEEGAR
jgi:hypothetical protein